MKKKSGVIPVNEGESLTEFERPNSLHHLFVENIFDIYDAEQQLLEILDEFAEEANSPDLKNEFYNYFEETKDQIGRIEKIFSLLNIEKIITTCEAMQGLIEEAEDIINEFEEGPVKDSVLIISAQKIGHYEIASYGSLCELANILGLIGTKEILGQSLDEEKKGIARLTEISANVYPEACNISSPDKENLP